MEFGVLEVYSIIYFLGLLFYFKIKLKGIVLIWLKIVKIVVRDELKKVIIFKLVKKYYLCK